MIKTPSPASHAVNTFREYLAVHPDACAGMGGSAMDDMALDLARIALDFKHLQNVTATNPVEAVIARRVATNSSGQDGSDAEQIRAAAPASPAQQDAPVQEHAIQPAGGAKVASALIRLDAIYREEANDGEFKPRPEWLVTALQLAATAPAQAQQDAPVYAPLPATNGEEKFTAYLYTQACMKAFADATHALRAQAQQDAPAAQPSRECLQQQFNAGREFEAERIAALQAAPPAPAGPDPVLYVSPEQLAKHSDPEGAESAEFGRYLPTRKTPAGKFTQPLYACPPAPAGVAVPAEDMREKVTLALGLSSTPKGGPSFSWSYLLDSIRELVKCEEELVLLKAGQEMSKARAALAAAPAQEHATQLAGGAQEGARDAEINRLTLALQAAGACLKAIAENRPKDEWCVGTIETVRAFAKDRGQTALDAARGAAPVQAQEDARDTEMLNILQSECWDLRCISVATGGDDAEVHWQVIEHHMAAPHEREVGRAFNDDPRAAIRAAIAAARAAQKGQP
ncbi:hypothetical protein [Comamonas antarctica]|uniref:hypothetical protein n=1 Tax=Comamonas antarctica TaxID=2743470 RepID=UPI0028EEB9C4|nr:hypothetical protein [Comamonas antarctica]